MRGATTLRNLAALHHWSARWRYGVFAVARRLRIPVGIELMLNIKPGQEIIERDGYRFVPRPRSADLVALLPIHELITRRWIERHLASRPRGVFLDVGAHCGGFSILFERHFSRVIAIEPLPDNQRALRRNLALNGNSLDRKVQLVPFAAGACDAEGLLHLASDDTPSLVAGIAGESRETLKVQVRRLDTILSYENLTPLDVSLVKLDVEGAEIEAIQGASRLLAEGDPLVVAEANDKHAAFALLREMERRDYHSDGMLDSRNLVFRKAIAPSSNQG